MHYYIDGYNLLFRLPAKKSPLQKKRQDILLALNDLISSLGLDVTVVFDSSEKRGGLSARGHFEMLEVVYTDESQTADEYIIEAINASQSPSQETVVTSDRELSRQCKALGSRTQTIEAFLNWLETKKKKKKKISSPALQKIFEESPTSIARLIVIFEKRLMDDLEKEKKK